MNLHAVWDHHHFGKAMVSVAKAPEWCMESAETESPTKDLLDVIEFVQEQHRDPWQFFGDKGSRN